MNIILKSISVTGFQKKIMEWFSRYAPAEIAGTFTAILGAFLSYKLTGNEIISAYAGSLSENLGFYAVMMQKEYKRYTKGHSWQLARNLLLEFGPVEMIDSFMIRPFFMGIGLHFLGQGIGLFLGKIMADLSFYGMCIIGYDARKKLNK